MASERLGVLGGAAVGIVLGFVLGGIGPRRDLAATQAELSRTRDELVELQSRRARRGPLGMLGLGEPMDADAIGDDALDAPAPRPAADLPPPPSASPSVVGDDTLEPEGPGPAELRLADFDAAVDAQLLRKEQSRAALIEQADLDDEQIAELDATIDEMNARLGAFSDELMDLALSGGDPDTPDMLHAVHEVSGVLYDAQVQLDDIVGQDQLDDIDSSAREVWNQIDLETFRDTVEAAQEEGLVPE